MRILESGVDLVDGSLFNRAVTPVIDVTDASPVTTDALLNGVAFTSGATVTDEGSYELAVTATDDASNVTSLSVSFEIDTTAPAFGDLTPAEGTLTSASAMTLQGDVSGADSLTVDGQAVSLVGTSFTAGPYALSEGERIWTLVATDAAGNATTRQLRIVRDSTPPAVSIGQPLDGAVVAASPVDAVGTVSDLHLDGGTVTVNGVEASRTDTTFVARNLPLAEGPTVLTATAADAAGNSAQATRTVTLDTLPPSLAITDPASGTVVPDASLPVSGTATDPHLDRVEVNGAIATLTAGSWTGSASLTEGVNTITVQAFDQLGRVTTDSVTMLRDSTAPEIRITAPAEGSYLGGDFVDVQGTVVEEAGLTVTVNGVAATISAGTFSATAVPLVEGENRLISRVVDSLGNQGAHTRIVYRDTVAPTVDSFDPAAGALAVPPDARFVVTFSEEMADPPLGAWRLETLAGVELTTTGSLGGADRDVLTVQPDAPLPSTTDIKLILTNLLVDLAGNALADAGSVSFTTADTVAPDAPVLSATPPDRLCGSRVTLSGTAEAGSVVTVTGGVGTGLVRAEDGTFSLDVDLRPESVNLLIVTASDRDDNISDPLQVQVIHDCTSPQVIAAELSGDQAIVAFDEEIDPVSLAGAVTLTTASGPIAGSVAATPDSSGALNQATFTADAPLPAEPLELTVTTSVVDLAGNPLAFPFSTLFKGEVTVSFLGGRVLDTATGRPLTGAQVVVASTDGITHPEPQPEQTTGDDGRFRIPVPAGTHYLMALRPGYTPVMRIATTASGLGADVFDPRLTPATEPVSVGSSGATLVGEEGEVLDIPNGALAASVGVSLTLLEEQALPALLPYGWSPRGAAWLDFGGGGGAAFLSPATLTLPVDSADGVTLVIARVDQGTLQWHAEAELQVTDGAVTFSVPGEGGWAAVEADTGTVAPPAAVVGTVLGSAPAPAGTEVLGATLQFDPAVVLPSQRSEVTGTYQLTAEAASGLPLTLSIREDLTLLDGTVRRQPPYEADLVLYHAPDGTPRSKFGLRPSLQAQVLPLEMGAEDVTVRRYAGETVRGNVLGPTGGTVATPEGDRIDVAAGAVPEPVAVGLERRAEADLPLTLPPELEFVGVLDLDLGGVELAVPAALSYEVGAAPVAGETGLLFEVVDLPTGSVLRPVAELAATASGWTTAAIDTTDLPWTGVRREGLYVFAKLLVDVGFFRGSVFDVGGNPLAGAVVSAAGGSGGTSVVPWMQISGEGTLVGRYVLPAPLGTWTVTAENPANLNRATGVAAFATADERVDLDLFLQATGPELVSSVPADGAVDVIPGIEPTLQFSEAVDPASAATGIQLVTDGTPVPADLEVQGGSLVRIVPRATLVPGAGYQIKLSTALKDLQGFRLAQAVTVTFTVQEAATNEQLDRSKIFLFEPDAADLARVQGLAGAAPAGALVFAENITRLATTASDTVAADGSFDVSVTAALTDTLLLHVVITGQNEIVFELTPFLTLDGQGAYVEPGEHRFATLDGVEVLVEEGTFLEEAVVRVAPQPVTEARVPVPDDLDVVYLFDLGIEGATPQKALHLRFPRPAASTTTGPILLTRIYDLFGQRYWMLFDLLRDDGGMLTTEPPLVETAALAGPRPVATVASLGGPDPWLSVLPALTQEDAYPGGVQPIAAPTTLAEQKGYMPGLGLVGRYAVLEASFQAQADLFSFVAVPYFPNTEAYFLQTTMEGMVAVFSRAVSMYLKEDSVLIPVRRNQDFTLQGRDLTTGYSFFEGTFPGPTEHEIPLLPPTFGDLDAPVPVAGSPLRFFAFTAGSGKLELLPGLEVELENGTLSFTGTNTDLLEGIQLRLIGLDDTVDVADSVGAAGQVSLITPATLGNRYLLAVGARIDSREPLSITFDEGLAVEPEGVEVRDSSFLRVWPDLITDGRELLIVPSTGWRAGETHTLRLLPALADPLGNSWGETLELDFEVEPSGVLPQLALSEVREIVRLGGLLFIAAGPDGLAVVDASKPSSLSAENVETYPWPLNDAVMGVALDAHNRILAVGGGVQNFGVIKIFDPVSRTWRGSTILSDKLLGDGLPQLESGTPRHVAALTDDQVDTWLVHTEGQEPPADLTVTPEHDPANLQTGPFTLTVSGSGWTPNRPVTLRNLTRGRWARVDTDDTSGAYSLALTVEPGDRVELRRNLSSLAYVATLGVGLQVVNVDAFYNEEIDGTDSHLLGGFSGQVSLCSGFPQDISINLGDVQTLFDPTNAHPMTLVTLIILRGLALFESERSSPGDVSFFNQKCGGYSGTKHVVGLRILEDYPLDVDGDGVVGDNEIRDYAIVGHRTAGVLIFDLTDRDNIYLASWIKLSGQAGQISVDRDRRLIYVSSFGAGLYVVDFDSGLSVDPVDENGDSKDDRVLEQIDLTGSASAATHLIPELGLAFGGGLEDDGAGGCLLNCEPTGPTQPAGLTGVAFGGPRMVAVVEETDPEAPSRWRAVDRLAPLGVPTAPSSTEDGAPNLPAVFRILAHLPGVASENVVGGVVKLDLVSLGPGGLPVDGPATGSLTGLPPVELTDTVTLHRFSSNPLDEGYHLYLSDPVVALADLRAARDYELTAKENTPEICPRCDHDAMEVPPAAHEILSGYQIVVRPSAELRTALLPTYGEHRLERMALSLESTPWDLSPAVRQEPTLNPSYGGGIVAPGTLLHSGEQTLEATDLTVRGRRLAFAFTRTYRNQALVYGPLGPGWDFGYRMRLRELPDGDVEFFDGRGRRELFTQSAGNDRSLQAPTGRFWTLDRHTAGYTLIDERRNVLRFDPFGRLISIADFVRRSPSTGNLMTFHYDLRSRLVKVVDDLERAYHLEYDTEGRLAKIKDFDGREVVYGYDTEDRLVSVRSPVVATGISTFPGGLITRYGWNVTPGANLTEEVHLRDNLVSVTDPKGQDWLQISYADADGDLHLEEVTGQTWGAGTLSISYDFTLRTAGIIDRRNHLTAFTHNAAGQRIKLVDPVGATFESTYDEEGLETSSKLPLGRITTYQYPVSATGDDRRSRGNVVKITVAPDSRGPNGSSGALGTTFTYETYSNQPTSITDPRGAVTTIDRQVDGEEGGLPRTVTEPEGRVTRYEYNDYGQVTKLTNPNGHVTEYRYFDSGDSEGYLRQEVEDPGGLGLTTRFETDTRGNVTAVIDPRNVRHEHVFNEVDWRVESTRAATGTSDGKPALGYTTRWAHDANGNVTEVRRPFGLSGTGSTSDHFSYGVLDELTEVRRGIAAAAGEAVETYTYDANLNLLQQTAPNGQVAKSTYDDRDLAVQVTRGFGTVDAVTESFVYNKDRELLTRTDGRLNVWTTSYDGYGRVREVKGPLGNRTVTSYDDNANPVAVSSFDAAGPKLAETTYGYDKLNRRTTTTQKLWSGGSGTRDLTTTVAFDPASNVTQVTDPLGRTTSFQYDSAERRIQGTDAAGNVMDYVLDPGGNTTRVTTHERAPAGGTVPVVETMEYDALGRQVAYIDALGNRSTTTWDARGLPRVFADAEGFLTTHDYDGLDRRIRTTRPEGISETFDYDASSRLTDYVDAQGNRTTYAYDALDRMTSKTYPDTTVYSYQYDATHNVTQIQDPNGSVFAQTWDAANRMTRRDVTPGAGVVGPTVETYTYDGLSRVTRAASGAVATDLSYDSASRVLSETTNGRSVAYSYDDAANPVEVSYPSGHVVARTFDNLDRPATIGEKLAGGGVDPAVSYGYRGPHLLAQTDYGNGITGTRQFDAARRLLDELKTAPTGGTVFQESLSWSPRSLKVAQSRGDRNGSGLVLSYDGAQRLTRAARRPAPTTQAANNTVPDPATLAGVPEVMDYQYDTAQNLLARTERKAGVGQTMNLPLDGSGRNRPGSLDGVTLEYDANGNLTRKGDLHFEYDFRNRMTRVTDGVGQEVASYSYDAINRRVAKTISGVTEETVWSGWQAVEEYQGGQLDRRRTFGQGLDEVVEVSRDLDGDGTLEANYVPLYDSSGFLAAMTGPDGKPVERYEYTPFGDQTILVDSTPPAVEQVRWVAGELWLEMSEEVSAEALADAVSAETLTLEDTLAVQDLPISVSQPVEEGRQARQRVVITPADPLPADGTELTLTLPPESLKDLFLNEAAAAFTLTFNWPAADAVLFDDVPPKVEQVVVLDSFLEIQLSEEPDVATATSAITLDGQPLTWALQADGYTLKSDSTLALGSHTLDVGTGLADLQGQALAQAESFVFELAASADDLLVYQAPDPRVTPTSTVGNRVGFQGHEKDPETGLVYVRNRYYDPELGRFITTDPQGYADGPSLYQFAGYSPPNFGDPYGRLTIFFNGINNQSHPGLDPEETAFYQSLEDPTGHIFNKPTYGPAFNWIKWKGLRTLLSRIEGGGATILTFMGLRGAETREVWNAIENQRVLETMLDPGEPIILIAHSGGRPVAQRVAKKIRKKLKRMGDPDHTIWIVGYNGGFDRKSVPRGMEGIRVVSKRDAALVQLTRLWKRGDITIAGKHGPDLPDAPTIFNAMILLTYIEAWYPGKIGSKLGDPNMDPSEAVIKYMNTRINTMNPGKQDTVLFNILWEFLGWAFPLP